MAVGETLNVERRCDGFILNDHHDDHMAGISKADFNGIMPCAGGLGCLLVHTQYWEIARPIENRAKP